jgi:hypothetical protein
MITTISVRGMDVTAEQVGHFAVCPAVLQDEDTRELFLDASTWVIHHIPSDKTLMVLHEADPIEWPGHPLAVDLDIMRDFLEWFEPFADWSQHEPTVDLSDADKRIYMDFQADPVLWKRPQAADGSGITAVR